MGVQSDKRYSGVSPCHGLPREFGRQNGANFWWLPDGQTSCSFSSFLLTNSTKEPRVRSTRLPDVYFPDLRPGDEIPDQRRLIPSHLAASFTVQGLRGDSPGCD